MLLTYVEEINPGPNVEYGETVKFERTNIEYEENEFERIRGEYNVQEN